MVDLRRFFELILPWPDHRPGFINLHWTSPWVDNPSRTSLHGTPFTNVEDFMSRALWLRDNTSARDIYFCTSLQSQATRTQGGKPKAIRSQKNVLALRALFFDLDAKNYASKQETADAFGAFLHATALMPPTAIVDSGGGFHIYWALTEDLPPAEWQPYANGLRDLAVQHGLKIDGSVTIDSARILRVPNTYNSKQNPRKLVQLKYLQAPYDISQFEPYKAKTSRRQLPATVAKLAGAVPVIQGKDAPLPALHTENKPLDPEPIFKGCEFLRTALETGGADYAQPAWHLTALAATFLEDGYALCHRMSDKHPKYSKEDTDAMWERKLKDREEKGIGWPSCQTIQDNGSTVCGNCSFKDKIKSPLSLAVLARNATVEQKIEGDIVAHKALCLPEKARVYDGIIHWEDVDRKGNSIYRPLFFSHISDPWAQANPVAINFTTSLDQDKKGQARILFDDMGESGIMRALRAALVKYVPENKRFLEDFFVAWLDELHKAAESIRIESLGWYMPDGHTMEGFVYGGRLFLPGDKIKPVAAIDPALAEDFTPRGELGPWMDACRLITSQHRPALEIIVLQGAASCLVKASDEASACLSVYSQSGSGKTTSFMTGLAIWGHPRKARDVDTSTEKGLLAKAGQLGSLPIYLDDVNDPRRQDQVIRQVFGRSQGTDATRMQPNLSLTRKKTWNSVLIISSNRSFAERVMLKQPDHDAGLKRVFEIKLDTPPKDRPGAISTIDANRIFGRLQAHFGRMGERYAQYLANHIKEVDELVVKVTKEFEVEFKIHQSERFWTTIVGATVVAGTIMNELGCDFNLPEIRELLVKSFYEQRKRLKEDHRADPTSLMGEFFREHHAKMIWTSRGSISDKLRRPGRPYVVQVIKQPASDRDAPIVQWDQSDMCVRFYRSAFTKWLTELDVSFENVIEGLRQNFTVTAKRVSLAKGTPWSGDYNWVLEIAIGDDKENPFYGQLFRHAAANQEIPTGGAG